MIPSNVIKELREKTGVSVMECKKALVEAGGDVSKAEKALMKRFGSLAEKKAGRETKAGLIDVYLHSNSRVGVMLELHCETDFVAKNPAFRELAHDIALHVAAMNPLYRAISDIPAEVAESERKEIEEEVKKLGKPKDLADKVIEGKLAARLSEISLMSQPFVKDADRKVADLIQEAVGKFGENIKVGRFVRYSI